MVHTPMSFSRRSLFALFGLRRALTGSSGSAADDPIFTIARRRDVLQALIDETRDEDERDRLCAGLDAMAQDIAALPTLSLASAHLKLRIVAEDYVEAHTAAGFDRRLLDQVLEWMTLEMVARE